MTRKELNTHIEKRYSECCKRSQVLSYGSFYDGYVDCYCEQQKRIEKLEQQIEKMKCCGNCNKLRGRFDSKTNINILYCSDSDMKQIEVGFQMCCCKWEIKENDN